MGSKSAVLETSAFPYAPLDREQRLIRLLRVLPSIDPSSPVECRLEHVLLEAGDISYEALSYTWGSGRKTHAITLDGRIFPVTSNLVAALLQLRYQDHDRYLWIDAICINQSDIAERSREVLRMLLIYQRARRVIVWLGDQSYNSGLAMEHFRQLDREWTFSHARSWPRRITRSFVAIPLMAIVFGASLLGTARDRPSVAAWSMLFFLGWLPAMPFWLLQKLMNLFSWYTVMDFVYTMLWAFRNAFARTRDQKAQPDEALVRSLADFFGRSWFQRAWIIQEIAAAWDVTVFCGPHSMPWQTLVNACQEIEHRIANSMVRGPYNDTKYSSGAFLRLIVSKAARDDAAPSEPEPVETAEASAKYLTQLLGQFRYCQATDDRDRIYALLGLAFRANETAAGQELLVPDYSKPTPYVYSELVRLLVTTTGRLDILRHCEGYRQVPGLPSWAPDWTLTGLRVSSPSAVSTKGYIIPSDPKLPVATFSDDLRTLSVQGFVIGNVSKISDVVLSTNRAIPDKRSMLPNFAGYIIRYFLSFSIWFSRSGLAGISVKFIQAVLRLLVALFPQRTKLLVTLRDVLQDAKEAVAADNEQRVRAQRKSRIRRSDEEFSWAGIPVSMENAFEALHATDEYVMRSIEWETTLRNPFVPAYSFETSVRDPQLGDVVCMLVGSGDTCLLRKHGEQYSLVGMADLSMRTRWFWKDCLREFEEGTLRLDRFELV